MSGIDAQKPPTVVGPFPGPRHGMAVVTEAVAAELGAETRRVDTAATSFGRGLAVKLNKLANMIGGVVSVARGARSTGVMIIAVDSGEGMYFNAAMVAAARLARTPVILQHHTEAYLHEPFRTMAFMQQIGGRHVTNALLCECAAETFADTYGLEPDRVTVLGNAFSVPTVALEPRPGRPVTVGHLANLSEPKGAADLVPLAQSQPEVSFLIAGPAVDDVANEALATLGQLPNVTLLGQLDAEGVRSFHQRCDIFVMPSKSEAMPLVVWEALAAGCVVLSYPVGCVPSMAPEPSIRIADDLDALTALLADEVAAASARCGEQWQRSREQSAASFLERREADQARIRSFLHREGS